MAVEKYDPREFMRRTGCCEAFAHGYGCWRCGTIMPLAKLRRAKTKPRGVSESRWRIELSRRRMDGQWEELGRKAKEI